ncbi:hypothetical protein IVB27_28620 [Bradyrhizobium sp. 197]|uniref:hypothetical protein n=1 Tax=Bradyrhizobium sp. 197 TaxID=2782663 RepID=UPI001FF85148|nr:hypothetical protein [Bradyrhizobium sp. 197]MCK1478605.1 hypothetical protein [Bradyrhizobium sp. 197]
MTDAEKVPLKDAVVLVPLMASSLAIAWEVGRFLPFGGFLLFTFSEHMLAAMNALPIALAFTVYFVGIVIVLPKVRVAARTSVDFTKEKVGGHIGVWSTIAVVSLVALIAALCAMIYYIVKHISTVSFSIIPIAALVTIVLANQFVFKRPVASSSILSLLAGTAIVFAMAASVDQSRRTINAMKDGSLSDFRQEVFLKSAASIKGFLLMAGDRGVLIYLPEGDALNFVRNDDVQRIEWRR